MEEKDQTEYLAQLEKDIQDIERIEAENARRGKILFWSILGLFGVATLLAFLCHN